MTDKQTDLRKKMTTCLIKGSKSRQETTMGQNQNWNGNDVTLTLQLLKAERNALPQFEIHSLRKEPSSAGDGNEGLVHPLLACYFVTLPHVIDCG